MNLRPKRRGSAAFEQLAVIALVAVVGAAGLRSLGGAAGDAIAEDAAGAAVSAPTVMAVSSQAGAVELVGKAAKVAEDTSFLADDVRAVRTKAWARPRYAFGDKKNQIQLSLEKEGSSLDIFEGYRNEGFSEKQWAHMDEDARAGSIRRQGALGEGMGWSKLIRRDDFLPTLSVGVLEEVDGLWEISSAGYQVTLDSLFGDATYLDDVLGEGGYHWHVSFLHDPQHADAVANYWRHADEYLRLLAVFLDPANLRSAHLLPIQDSGFGEAVSGLRLKPMHAEDKYHLVGLRGGVGSGVYGKKKRIGLEIRGANEDLGVAARLMHATVRFLENPTGARIRFNEGTKAYGSSAIARPVETAHAIPEGHEWTRPFGVQSAASLPFVRWEDRPWLAAKTDKIVAARAKYAKAITPDMPAVDFEDHLDAWARSLKLHERY